MRFLPIVFIVLSCCARGGDSDDGGLLFSGESKLLEGFTFNTGPQPSTGPASVSLRLSGDGALKVSATGIVEGDKLAGKPGTGRIDLGAHVKLDGSLKIDTAFKKSDGDIPGLKDIDIPITGSATFDPFLLDGNVVTTADIPETKLPDVPLGSVPGKLRLTVKSGSKLTSKYQGTCLTIASGVAHYEGQAATGGTIVLKGTIVLELPAPLNQEIAIPELEIAIPSATPKLVFGDVAVPGVADGTFGTCATPAKDAGVEKDVGEVTADTGTPAETAPPCTDHREPDDTQATAHVLGKLNDCDGSAAMVYGVFSSNTDVDVLRFEGEDTFGCAVNAFAEVVSGPAEICMRPVCIVGTTEFQGCNHGVREGDRCCGTRVEAKFNCQGTTKDSAHVYMSVRNHLFVESCASYSLRYHY
jgi:hypothetical protein